MELRSDSGESRSQLPSSEKLAASVDGLIADVVLLGGPGALAALGLSQDRDHLLLGK